MPAIIRYNLESDQCGGELPDGSLFGPEDYDDSSELLFSEDGTPYLAAYDEADENEGLEANTVYQLSPSTVDVGLIPHDPDDDSSIAHQDGKHYLVTYDRPPEGLEANSTYELTALETTVDDSFDFESSEDYADEDDEEPDTEVDVDGDEEEDDEEDEEEDAG